MRVVFLDVDGVLNRDDFDDLPDMGPLSGFHVRVDSARGLDDAAVSAARRLLAG